MPDSTVDARTADLLSLAHDTGAAFGALTPMQQRFLVTQQIAALTQYAIDHDDDMGQQCVTRLYQMIAETMRARDECPAR